jgi:hypothetical protein
MYSMRLSKNETNFSSIEQIIAHFKVKIKENPEAVFIAVFDHYAHTKELGGEILEDILDAKNLLFCFGHTITDIDILAFRPKSIAICETKDHFILEFLETPRPEVNQWIQDWIKALKK